ncbi:SUMF1/EgtB/PvdO family nonheme iron enzyme [Desulfobacterales bacterium HSG2]|nr:SUMF1/EgtB/PvdO family nonheme iron enzyme [Desulfobacterales bacterium HSG2]
MANNDKSKFSVKSDKAEGVVQAGKIKTLIQNFQESPVIWFVILIIFILALIAVIGILPSGDTDKPPVQVKESPCFAIDNPILRSDAAMVITAKNDSANRHRPLDIQFDDILFSEKGIPKEHLKNDEYLWQKWHFVLKDQNPTEEMVKKGHHRVRVGFPAEMLSDDSIIVFTNVPPVVRVETAQSESDPDQRIIRGKAASEFQIPGNTISVEVLYFHDGPSQEINIPVRTKEDSETGVTYFEFETTVQGLPRIPADDPRYVRPFFGFRITDQAGNKYYQEQNYAQYMAPGSSRFGFNDFAMIKVERLPEDEKHQFKNIIRMTPPIQRQLTNGEPAIILNVRGIASTRRLTWKSNVKNRQPITLVFDDERQIGYSFTDEYTDDRHLDKEETVTYTVEQEGEDGTKYRSNDETYTEKVKVMLTVRSKVYNDTVYIDGKKHGSTRLDIELERGKHILRVEKDGYEPYEKEVDLQKPTTIWAKLDPVTEIIRIETDPSGATVFVNGGKKGVSPTNLKLSATEKVRLSVKLAGYKTQEKIIRFPFENSEALKFVLVPLPKQTGSLYVKVSPSDALIHIRDIKEKYKHGMELQAGDYVLEISAKGYESSKENVEIIPGKMTETEVELKRIADPRKTIVKPFVNSLKMKFVYISPGTFMMGSPDNESGRDDDEKQHKVTLTKGFYMQTTEVTQGQWKAITGSNLSDFKDCGDDCPVESVSWNDVQRFIRNLNKRGEGTYRLPTEAEWEYACRADTKTAYYFGNNSYRLSQYAWYRGNSGDRTHPVGKLRPNPWGLYDMHGNVWEWCRDWYGEYPSGTVTDPTRPDRGSYRVLRGGGWGGTAGHCRSANRHDNLPGKRGSSLGLRLALSPGQQDG